ncbi:hypothetical protein WJ12_00060 [Burkholderia seminalis]|nr:hypothetical protein WJ12_00060 [Burkholderia seminalis]KVF43313.1 hypothetical protein WJ13_00940 [Burkholderia seminalis]
MYFDNSPLIIVCTRDHMNVIANFLQATHCCVLESKRLSVTSFGTPEQMSIRIYWMWLIGFDKPIRKADFIRWLVCSILKSRKGVFFERMKVFLSSLEKREVQLSTVKIDIDHLPGAVR